MENRGKEVKKEKDRRKGRYEENKTTIITGKKGYKRNEIKSVNKERKNKKRQRKEKDMNREET